MDPRLLKATRGGDAHIFRKLLELNPAMIMRVTPLNNTPLHIAARYGHRDLVSEILSLFPWMIDQVNSKGNTPLHVAARAGHMEVVELLVLFSKSDVETGTKKMVLMKNGKKNTALHEAVRGQHYNVVSLLTNEDPSLCCMVNEAGESPLYVAAEEGYEQMVHQILVTSNLVSSEADAAATAGGGRLSGPNGRTPLHAAVIRGHFEITIKLLTTRPELQKQGDDYGSTPLHYAASTGNLKIVGALLQPDPSIAYLLDGDGRSPIHMAASNGHINVIEEIIQRCPDAGELVDRKGHNILHMVVEEKNTDAVRYILKTPGLEELINEQDNEGNTALHLATMNRHHPTVYLFVDDRRVDMKIINNDNLTALDIAEFDSQPSMILRKFLITRALIRAGAPRSGRQQNIGQNRQHLIQEDGTMTNSYKTKANNLSLVATLIATVTFTAALTMPGGYNSEGKNDPISQMAALRRNVAFKVFLISDALAMCSSTTVSFLLIWASARDRDLLVRTLRFSMTLMWLAFGGMAVAFVTGVSVVIDNCPWLTSLICAIGCSIPFIAVALLLSPLTPLALNWRRIISRSRTSASSYLDDLYVYSAVFRNEMSGKLH